MGLKIGPSKKAAPPAAKVAAVSPEATGAKVAAPAPEQKKTRESFYEKTASHILKVISESNGETTPWRRPYSEAYGNRILPPMNALSGRPYSGVNRILLSSKDSFDPRWMTRAQAEQCGMTPKPGARPASICVPIVRRDEKDQEKPLDRSDAPEEPTQTAKALKSDLDRPPNGVFFSFTNVYHASDIEGMTPYDSRAMEGPKWQPCAEAEKFIKAYFDRPLAEGEHPLRFEEGGDRACYMSGVHKIVMPPRSAFEGEEGAARYYAVLIHEIAHSTKYNDAVPRNFPSDLNRSDPEDRKTLYALEELRAEMASASLCGFFGLPSDLDNHAEYVRGWSQHLKDQPGEIARASKDAEAIGSYLMRFYQGEAPAVPRAELDHEAAERNRQRLEAAKIWRYKTAGLDDLTGDERELARQSWEAQKRKGKIYAEMTLGDYVSDVQKDNARKRAKAASKMVIEANQE